MLLKDPARGREELARMFDGEQVLVRPRPGGFYVAEGTLAISDHTSGGRYARSSSRAGHDDNADIILVRARRQLQERREPHGRSPTVPPQTATAMFSTAQYLNSPSVATTSTPSSDGRKNAIGTARPLPSRFVL